MKIMSVDYGDVRTGLAVCDRTEFLASPVGTIVERDFETLVKKVAYAATKELEVGMVVVGLPRNMDGSYGFQSEKVKAFADLVLSGFEGEHAFYDERLTTVAAERALGEASLDWRARRKVVDKVAAVMILQGYLATNPKL